MSGRKNGNPGTSALGKKRVSFVTEAEVVEYIVYEPETPREDDRSPSPDLQPEPHTASQGTKRGRPPDSELTKARKKMDQARFAYEYERDAMWAARDELPIVRAPVVGVQWYKCPSITQRMIERMRKKR